MLKTTIFGGKLEKVAVQTASNSETLRPEVRDTQERVAEGAIKAKKHNIA
jgi:hypothetical protein